MKHGIHLPFELENREMEAGAYWMSLHLSLHRHLLPHHDLFLHCHFLLNHGFAFCRQRARVGALLLVAT